MRSSGLNRENVQIVMSVPKDIQKTALSAVFWMRWFEARLSQTGLMF